VLLGAPGAGKGTQARKLSESFVVPDISTGEIFRNAVTQGTKMGKAAKRFIDRSSTAGPGSAGEVRGRVTGKEYVGARKPHADGLIVPSSEIAAPVVGKSAFVSVVTSSRPCSPEVSRVGRPEALR